MGNRYHPGPSAIRSKTVRAAHSAVPAPRPSGAGKPLPSGYLAVLLTVLCAVGLSLGTPSETNAQTVAACGLPASGTITSNVTYTLTGDCTQTGELAFKAAVTIEGNGYTISGASITSGNMFKQQTGSGSNVTFRDVTIANTSGGAAVYRVFGGNALTFQNVSFNQNSAGTVLWLASATPIDAALNDVFFWDNSASAGGSVYVQTRDLILNNVSFLANSGGDGPIRAYSGTNVLSYASGSCATFTGNTPDNIGNANAKSYSRPGDCNTAKRTVGNGRPTNVQAAAGAGEVTLNWALNSDEDDVAVGFQYRYKEGSGSYGSWNNVGKVRSHTVTGLTGGTAHTFQLRTRYARDFRSAGSKQVSATPTAPTGAPPQPTLIEQKVTGGGTSGADQFVVFWDTPYDADAPVTSFEVHYKDNTDPIWNGITTPAGVSLTSFPPVVSARTTIHHTDGSLNSLLPATCYEYRVRAVSNGTPSPGWTETANCVTTFGATDTGLIPAPARATVDINTADRTQASFTVARPIAGSTSLHYEVQRRAATCAAGAYTTIRNTNQSGGIPVTSATKVFVLSNLGGTGTDTDVPSGVANAEPVGLHLYRARVAGGSWSLPVLIRTNADGTKEVINHASATSWKDRHHLSSMTCVAP